MADGPADLALTPDQYRQARELLGWNMLDLAEASGVRMVTLMKIEDGTKPPPPAKVERVRRAFQAAGVVFRGDTGVELAGQPSAEGAILPREAGRKP